MNFRASPLLPLTAALLTAGLALSPPSASAGNPLKAISSGIKKVGGALIPGRKKEADANSRPAPKALPVESASPKKSSPSKPARAASKKTSAKTNASKVKSRLTGKSASGKKEAAAAVAAAGAAGSHGPEKPDGKPHDPSADAPSQTSGTGAASSSAGDSAGPGTAGSNGEPPPAPAPAATLAELPFATPVMGRKGYVRSPYAEEQGMVDVTGIAAGAKAKCPYTGKIFRVP